MRYFKIQIHTEASDNVILKSKIHLNKNPANFQLPKINQNFQPTFAFYLAFT